jgi:hypothetical protein
MLRENTREKTVNKREREHNNIYINKKHSNARLV